MLIEFELVSEWKETGLLTIEKEFEWMIEVLEFEWMVETLLEFVLLKNVWLETVLLQEGMFHHKLEFFFFGE